MLNNTGPNGWIGVLYQPAMHAICMVIDSDARSYFPILVQCIHVSIGRSGELCPYMIPSYAVGLYTQRGWGKGLRPISVPPLQEITRTAC